MANIIAPACSAAFPTIGSKITLINATGIFKAVDAPCRKQQSYAFKIILRSRIYFVVHKLLIAKC